MKMDRLQAAEYIKNTYAIPCSRGYLAKIAMAPGGPAFYKIAKNKVLYDQEELDRWAKTKFGPLQTSSKG